MAKHVEFESGNILDLLNIEFFFEVYTMFKFGKLCKRNRK